MSSAMIFLLLLCLGFPATWATASPKSPKGFTSHHQHIAYFRTEHKFQPEEFNIIQEVKDRSQLSPGYFFIDPIFSAAGWGPQIYDINGTLIWHGVDRNRSQNLHVCDFQGRSGYLCTSNRAGGGRYPKAVKLPPGMKSLNGTFPINEVLDHTYKSVGRYRVGHEGLPFNIHAFQMLQGGNSFAALVAKPTTMDLRPYGGPRVGWVRNQCIDEIDTWTEKSLFHWCYLESGLKIWQTQVFPNTYLVNHSKNTTFGKAGRGTVNHMWDFLHFNAVDKNAQGDFYISVRYMDQIIKVAGPESPNGGPGKVLWRLGGKGNQFTFKHFRSSPPFTRTHDVRAISVAAWRNEEVITLFNNAWEGSSPQSQAYSDAQVIRINTKSMTAELIRDYPHPKWGHGLAMGRGSVQILPNDNVMVGWGALPHMTEFSANGTVLYHATFAKHDQKNPEFSYRALKFPWVGKPHWAPKLIAYSKKCSSPSITTYTSWNGATEVKYWRFFTARSQKGPWLSAGTYPKQGYETKVTLHSSSFPGFMSNVRVEALDSDGHVLGHTKQDTFVPTHENRHKCDSESCEPGFKYKMHDSRAQNCRRKDWSPYILLALVVLFVEAAVNLSQRMTRFSEDIIIPSLDGRGEETGSLIQGFSSHASAEKGITLS